MAAADSQQGYDSSAKLRCYVEKKKTSCPKNLSLDYTLGNHEGSHKENTELAWSYTLTMDDYMASLLPKGVITHSNMHACRKGLKICDPFIGETRLLSGSESVTLNIMKAGRYDINTNLWNLTYTDHFLNLKAGTYKVFAHVYFNTTMNATSTKRVRWDVTASQDGLEVDQGFPTWGWARRWVWFRFGLMGKALSSRYELISHNLGSLVYL